MPVFKDQTGKNISIDKTPQRIISLVPSQTELLSDLGLNEEVVGITKFCVHPDEWFRSKTRVGGTKQLKMDIIQQLKPYFITLLSHVNKGKAAKARAFAILRKEALKNEETARIAADIFTRVSVSMAIHEKAECIAALRDIHNTYASISSPVIKKVYSDYSKV